MSAPEYPTKDDLCDVCGQPFKLIPTLVPNMVAKEKWNTANISQKNGYCSATCYNLACYKLAYINHIDPR